MNLDDNLDSIKKRIDRIVKPIELTEMAKIEARERKEKQKLRTAQFEAQEKERQQRAYEEGIQKIRVLEQYATKIPFYHFIEKASIRGEIRSKIKQLRSRYPLGWIAAEAQTKWDSGRSSKSPDYAEKPREIIYVEGRGDLDKHEFYREVAENSARADADRVLEERKGT